MWGVASFGAQPVGLPFGQGLVRVHAAGLAGFDAAHGARGKVDVPPCEGEQFPRAQAEVGLEDEGVYRVLFQFSFRVVLFERSYEGAHFGGREDAVAV